jgi:hypothetical protein
VRGLQVVVGHAVAGRTLIGVGVVDVHELGGVGAEQIVEAEPARNLLGDQVAAHQLGQGPPDIRARRRKEAER